MCLFFNFWTIKCIIMFCLRRHKPDISHPRDCYSKFAMAWMSVLQRFLAIFWKLHKFVFCFIMFEPINTVTCSASENECLNFSFLKDIHVVDKKIARKGRKMPIYQSQVLSNSLYYFLQNSSQWYNFGNIRRGWW